MIRDLRDKLQEAHQQLPVAQASLETLQANLAERDAALARLKDKSDAQGIELLPRAEAATAAEAELRSHVASLTRIAQGIAETLLGLDLQPGPVDGSSIDAIKHSLAGLEGGLRALGPALVKRLEREGREIAGEVANAILPRVAFLAPSFPFDLIFEDFADDASQAAAEQAVAPLVEQVKQAMGRS